MKPSHCIVIFSAITTVIYFAYSTTVKPPANSVEPIAYQFKPSKINAKILRVADPDKHNSKLQPVILTSESQDGSHSESSITDMEMLELALAAEKSNDPALKFDAFNVLVELSPGEAVRLLKNIDLKGKNDPWHAQMLINGMMFLSPDDNYLNAENLKAIYEFDDPNVKKMAAQLLADKGDDSLANEYQEISDAKFSSENPAVRLQSLFDITALKKFNALPQMKIGLKDNDPSVRLQALNLFATYGSDVDVVAVESLINDPHPQVRAQAQLVVKDLWHKNSSGVMTDAQEFAPPNGMLQD
ncbi:MAG: HEAT repeat domain-containing protein [Pseudomonadota bacterium]